MEIISLTVSLFRLCPHEAPPVNHHAQPQSPQTSKTKWDAALVILF